MIAARRLARIEIGDLAGPEGDARRDLLRGNLGMKREKLLKQLAAEIDLLRPVDVRIEFGAKMTRKLLQAEMQSVE